MRPYVALMILMWMLVKVKGVVSGGTVVQGVSNDCVMVVKVLFDEDGDDDVWRTLLRMMPMISSVMMMMHKMMMLRALLLTVLQWE